MTAIQNETSAAATDRPIDLDAGRRAFLRTAGFGAASAAVLVGTGVSVGTAEAQALDDVAILNFALNLEYLEAEFYLRAAFGEGLSASDVTGAGTPGAVVGGRKVNFVNASVLTFAAEIARDERAHVQYLRAALGTAKVARPRIDLNSSFTAAARAAGLINNSQTFDAYASDENFLLAAYLFEDVGVTAYKGAARFISNKDYLEAAAGILAVEAYHAGEIRTLLHQYRQDDAALAISNLRDSVDGNTDLDQGLRLGGRVNIVPTDANGIAFSRSPTQVLPIVYLGGSNGGGFFPARMNGSIR